MVTVREARPADVGAIRAVHVASIRGLAACHYDDRQVESWSDIEESDYTIPADDAFIAVAEADGAVVGFGAVDLDAGEVRAVYVHPDHGREGVGTAILNALEHAAESAGLRELRLTASLNAVPFYENHRYESTGATTHRLADGVELAARAMAKTLVDE